MFRPYYYPTLAAAFFGLSLVVTQGADQHLEITGKHRFRITYETTFTWPDHDGGRAVMDLPIPPDTGCQQIESFSSSIRGARVSDAGGHRLLSATLHHETGDPRQMRWTVTVVGTFQMRQLVPGPPSATPVVLGASPGNFLASTESIDWRSGDFQEWLGNAGLWRRSGEPSAAFGHRLYTYLESHGRYTYPPSSAWSAGACCRRLRTDCGGFSLVFTAACRANGIPARLLVGQWFKAGHEEIGREAHVIAEFFDPQIGWIPEDISSTFLRTPGFEDFDFFGRDPGYFFAWHVDTDFHFDTPRKSDAHVQWIQNPNLWFSEDADEANDTVSTRWSIKTLD